MSTDDGAQARDALVEQAPSLRAAYDRLWDHYQALRHAVQADDWHHAGQLADLELTMDTLPPFNPTLLNHVCTMSDLSVRLSNLLQNHRFEFLWQVCQKSATELLRLKGFGRKAIEELESHLRERGLRLGMDVQGVKAHLRTPPDQRTANH